MRPLQFSSLRGPRRPGPLPQGGLLVLSCFLALPRPGGGSQRPKAAENPPQAFLLGTSDLEVPPFWTPEMGTEQMGTLPNSTCCPQPTAAAADRPRRRGQRALFKMNQIRCWALFEQGPTVPAFH
eukprot:5219406-Pyramimonas_sp.AAC.1